ncbi:MAG: hypothetical protein NVS4B3_07990 [Gemmatimonadaceae bacterium]
MSVEGYPPLPVRTFVDNDHEQWEVYEIVVPAEGTANRSLVFENKHAFRRVREYPNRWDTLTGEELLALSWAR